MSGRPTIYSPELAAEICSAISEGKSLRTICQQDGMPARSSVFLWLSQHKEFSDQYARAREAQADTLADEILAIADDATGDYRTIAKDGAEVVAFNGENVQRSRLRVDARKWYAGKVAPKKYGDKLELAGDPERPLAYVARVPATAQDLDSWVQRHRPAGNANSRGED